MKITFCKILAIGKTNTDSFDDDQKVRSHMYLRTFFKLLRILLVIFGWSVQCLPMLHFGFVTSLILDMNIQDLPYLLVTIWEFVTHLLFFTILVV